MREMTPEDARRFLAAGTRTGKLATTRQDSGPHVVPIWFVLDGDDLVFSTFHTTVKARNLRRDPRVALCVDDEAPPYAFVQVTGTAILTDDVEVLRPWARRLAARYMGEDLADAFAARNAVPGELLVRVTPSRIVAVADMSA